jgi:hypothetical protein
LYLPVSIRRVNIVIKHAKEMYREHGLTLRRLNRRRIRSGRRRRRRRRRRRSGRPSEYTTCITGE